ncbi:hypothetical protein PGT21_028251 [Puccinia graminis f. sp. tritici]|uniref:Uncharacterized protein n=1 Tax=Puccinia graminis f. sp. tritici TaxID=56615 RepID=A0A5B0PYZ5_PUCGR|nr:hypothetical protein PGT21_028251 [Puccinia graminis f. sp. tritici]
MHSRFMLAGLCSISTTFDGVIGPAIEGGAERGGIGLSHTPPVALARQDPAGDGEQLTSGVAQFDFPETSTTAALADEDQKRRFLFGKPIPLETPIKTNKMKTTGDGKERPSNSAWVDVPETFTSAVAVPDGRQGQELPDNPIQLYTPVEANKLTTINDGENQSSNVGRMDIKNENCFLKI